MTRPQTDAELFRDKTASVFRSQRQRHGLPSGLTLDAFREWFAGMIPQGCCYCGCPLTFLTATVEHEKPISRYGPPQSLAQLEVACGPCNEAKGKLDDVEFKALRQLVEGWDNVAQADVWRRLRMGGKLRTFNQKRKRT